LLEKAGDGDFLRAVAEAVLQLLKETDVEGLISSDRYEGSGERSTWRNGYRGRTLRLTPLGHGCRTASAIRRHVAAPS
jgi:putative transposase